jgi:hypothetical protein
VALFILIFYLIAYMHSWFSSREHNLRKGVFLPHPFKHRLRVFTAKC